MLSQEQYSVLQRNIRHLEIKIDLLNQHDAVILTLEGISLSGNINLQADSAYRRTGSLSMAMRDSTLIPSPNSKIWFNRKVKIYIGLRDWNDSVIWFDYGIFIIQKADIKNSIDENTINLDLTDSMSSIDGTQSGNLSHEVKIIPEGVTVAQALRSTLNQIGMVSIDDIKINDADATVPYEMSFQPNSTVYEIAKDLLGLFMGMEMFYDERGILIVQKIRDRQNDPVLWNFGKNGMDLAIDYQNQFDFSNVKNSVNVWGRKKNTGETVKWVYRNRFSRNASAEMNTIISKETGDICHVINENTSYVWNGSWKKIDFKVPVEFNMENIGTKQFSHVDEKIATVDQAMLRAEYELRSRSNFAESVSFTCVPIFGLLPNSKVFIEDEKSGIKGDYIVKSLSVPLDINGTMSISAEKIYY
jgi:hypothetical protein